MADDHGAFPTRDAALEHHFTYNCVPSIPMQFKEAAEQAIDAVNEDDSQREIELPNGETKVAWQVVEGMHLEGFLAEREEF